jgi:hypothetical protein
LIEFHCGFQGGKGLAKAHRFTRLLFRSIASAAISFLSVWDRCVSRLIEVNNDGLQERRTSGTGQKKIVAGSTLQFSLEIMLLHSGPRFCLVSHTFIRIRFVDDTTWQRLSDVGTD